MSKLPLGQLFVIGFDGLTTPPEAKTLLTTEGASGAILFKRNVETLDQVVDLNHQLTDLGTNEFPHLLSVDQEGGRVARLRGICTDLPPMRRVAELAVARPKLPYEIGAMMARELVSLGFHLDFAPVMDTDTNPANPIIGDRSFSHDAHEVAKLGAMFIQGMQGAGMAACAKHFPGHGDTHLDSHLDLPDLPHDMERLREVELVPFKAAVEANVASVMTAHVMFPALDDKYPATLSPAILSLLRNEMNYGGVVISDDLEMKAVADRYTVHDMVKLGLLAGVDLFLVCSDLEKAHAAIEAAHYCVERGEVPRARAEDALTRVAKMKRTFIGAKAPPKLAEAKQMVRAAPHLAMQELWA